MKKYKNKLILLLAVALSFSACNTVDFGDTNVDPSEPGTGNASTALILTDVQRSVSNILADPNPVLYVQYLSKSDYPEATQYSVFNFSPKFDYITNLDRIIKLNQDAATKVAAQANGSNANQIAVAKLLKGYFYFIMTDRWGMLPFSEANKGLEIPFPKYDTQQEIYNGVFELIDQALGSMTATDGPTGDILFGGDMATWAKFGNTLKMIMGLRLAKADPATGKEKFLEAYTKGISSVSENLKYTYLLDDSNDNPWQDRFETRADYLMSNTFVNKLIGSGTSTLPQDPRLPKMAQLSSSGSEYAGAIYGKANPHIENYSFITSDIIDKGDAPLMIFTYAEVCFARAEAGNGGLKWTTEDTATWYNNGIQASMDQWGVDATDAAAYIALKPYADISDIAYERWVSQFLQGYNSWAEWRRAKAMNTESKIALAPPSFMYDDTTDIPQRQAYSTDARPLNQANYDAAIAEQGKDNLNTILWINK
ncbi:SusD/RagB family nutrient-binding outer membrane lipoprotein [Tenacibaculum sp. UWU-22]|uniref:SusD/RagB family nutrient-binding outer membrane lipoprotein n=1 Tax=Tenacibaculum sp. UWU-22 TaxID=3234187 RepID=UPI0034DB6552